MLNTKQTTSAGMVIVAAAYLIIAVSLPVAAQPFLPDDRLAPGGVIETDASVVCQKGYSKQRRRMSNNERARLFLQYGME